MPEENPEHKPVPPPPPPKDPKPPSVLKVMWHRVVHFFWKEHKLDAFAGTPEEHVERKASVLFFYGFIAVVVGGIAYEIGGAVRGHSDKDVIEKGQSEVKDLNGKVVTLIQDRDKEKGRADKAEQELAPWIMLANSQYTNAPLSRRLNMLFDEVQSLTNVFALFNAHPQLHYFLNGLELTNGAVVTVSTTNDTAKLEFWVRNDGNADAEHFRLIVGLPNALNLTPSGDWEQLGHSYKGSGDSVKDDPLKDYLFLQTKPRDDDVTVGTFCVFNPMNVQVTNLQSVLLFTGVTGKARPNIKESISYMLHFTNGTTASHFGL